MSFKRDYQEARRFAVEVEGEKAHGEGSARRRPSRGFIYFIQAENGGPIKIGYAIEVRSRLMGLQIASPYELKVLLAEPGKLARERELHGRFAEHHLRGEWFSPAQEILDYIAAQGKSSL